MASRADQRPAPDDSFETSRSGLRPTCTTSDLEDFDLDRVFEQLESGAPPCGLPGAESAADPVADLESAALFFELALDHVRPLRDLVHELVDGPAPKQGIEVARSVVNSLLRVVEDLGHPALVQPLVALATAFDIASASASSLLEGRAREMLLAAYTTLARELPQVFALEQPACSPAHGR